MVARGFDPHGIDHPLGIAFHAGVIQQADFIFVVANIGDQRVEPHVQIGINPGGTTFFGDQCETVVYRFIGAVVVDGFTVQLDGTRNFFADAKQGFDDVGTFGPHQPGDAEDLALMQIERDVSNRRLAQGGQVLHLQDHLTRRILSIGETLAERTPHHHRDDLVHIQPFQRLGGDPLAITQNGDFVAQLEDLFHLMRDIDDAAAAFLQLADNGEQVVHLFFRQR
ncbi:hypothetical protein D3C71_1395170 [compost metagenome]